MTKREAAESFLSEHLWKIAAGGFAVANGFLVGQATTTKDVDENRRDIAEIRVVVEEMHPRK